MFISQRWQLSWRIFVIERSVMDRLYWSETCQRCSKLTRYVEKGSDRRKTAKDLHCGIQVEETEYLWWNKFKKKIHERVQNSWMINSFCPRVLQSSETLNWYCQSYSEYCKGQCSSTRGSIDKQNSPIIWQWVTAIYSIEVPFVEQLDSNKKNNFQ